MSLFNRKPSPAIQTIGVRPAVMVQGDPYAVDAPLNISRDYGGGWSGDGFSIVEPFIEPQDPIRESYENPRPQAHWVRVDEIWYENEAWPMDGERMEFPRGAAMAQGQMEVMDDYRLVWDGSHA